MNKKFLLVLFFYLCPFLSYSQDYAQTTWLGYGHDLNVNIHEIDSKGNAYVTANHSYLFWESLLFTGGYNTNYERVFSKLSPAGKLLWSIPFAADVYWVKADEDDNVYVSGVGNNIKLINGDILPNGSFVVKLDKAGNALWGVVSEQRNSSSISGPIALAENGIYWSSPFYGTTTVQGRTFINPSQTGSPDCFVVKIDNTGQVTASYQEKKSCIIQEMVEAENGNAAFLVSRGGIPKAKVILNSNCAVQSDKPFLLYGDFPSKFTKTPTGYEVLTGVGLNISSGYRSIGFYHVRFDRNLEVLDSTKVFEPYNPANPDSGGPFVLQGLGSIDQGFFLETYPNPYLTNYHYYWLHLDEGFNISTITHENVPGMIGGDPFRRTYTKMVGDTLHMLVRRFSYYYGKTFVFDKKSYTTSNVDDASWFWAKYVWRDGEACTKIRAQVLSNGKEGSKDVRIKFGLPDYCPATEDVSIAISLSGATKNEGDFQLPAQAIIKRGETSTELTIPVTDDNIMEPAETFALSCALTTGQSAYKLGTDKLSFKIDDDDNEDQISVDFPEIVDEGSVAYVRIGIPNGKLSPVDISFKVLLDKDTYQADKDIDFVLPSLVLPAFQNSIQLPLTALDDNLIEGEEYIVGTATAEANPFREFKANPSSFRVKISDPDNTDENRVFYISPLVDTIFEGKSQLYALQLKPPLKPQRSLAISADPATALPYFVKQSFTHLAYEPSGITFAVDHLENLELNPQKSVTFNWSAEDVHTGNYQFFWKHGLSNQMEIELPDKDFNALDAPNTFSPNGDGVNDTWSIKSLQGVNCKVVVINRYGAVVYRSTNYNTPWDGKCDNASLATGAYFYKITVKDKVFSGNVNILR